MSAGVSGDASDKRTGQVDEVTSKYTTRPLRIGVTTGASTPDEMIREVIKRMMTNEG